MYLVTGGAGFIGHHVVHRLLQLGEQVTVLDDLSAGRRDRVPPQAAFIEGSICDQATVEAACAGARHVIHLAARTSVPESVDDPALYVRSNVHGLVQMVTAAALAGVESFVLASSCAVYGDGPGPHTVASPTAPTSPYAATKLAGEAILSCLAGRVSATSLRFYNVVGSGQLAGGGYAAVIPAWGAALRRGADLTIYGTGEQTRDFVPVADIAQACIASGRLPLGYRALNIGSGHSTSLNHLAALGRRAGARLGVVIGTTHSEPRPGDILHSRGSDLEVAQRLLGLPVRRRDELDALLSDALLSAAFPSS